MPNNNSNTPPRTSTAARTAGWFSSLDRGAFQTVFLGIIAGVVVLASLRAASLIAIPTVLAVLCAIALAPLVRWLRRSGAPASLCAAAVVGGLLVGTAITAYTLAPSAEALNTRAPEILREAEWRARQILFELSPRPEREIETDTSVMPGNAARTTPDEPADPEADEDAVDKLVEGGQRLLADWAISAPRIVFGAAFWAMLTFYMLRDRVMLSRWMLSLVSLASTRRALARAMRDVRLNVAQYLLAITFVNIGLGLCVAMAFQLLGVANAPLWGVAAGLLNFMPFIGIAMVGLVTLGIGIASLDDSIVAFGEGFLMRVASERCALARPRPALENLPRRKPRGSWCDLWGKRTDGWGDGWVIRSAEGSHDS
ncbi:AI-2E family transporter [Yoonia sp.]|uniref:AI-2E family transporter n=1 Tax=Yoonia sp. TaxID=2212373 RepID=UPI003975C374